MSLWTCVVEPSKPTLHASGLTPVSTGELSLSIRLNGDHITLSGQYSVSSAAAYVQWADQTNPVVYPSGRTTTNATWLYQNPSHPYETLASHVAFYPGKMDACFVDGEQVQAQQGDFCGGWITNDIVEPFKGGEGAFEW